MQSQILTEENYMHSAYSFNDRQAGVSLVYDHLKEAYLYNVYCLETKIMKELISTEFDYLEEALSRANEEFGNWKLVELTQTGGGCGSCVAK